MNILVAKDGLKNSKENHEKIYCQLTMMVLDKKKTFKF